MIRRMNARLFANAPNKTRATLPNGRIALVLVSQSRFDRYRNYNFSELAPV